MKKSVIAQPPVNCCETIKIYVAEVFMSLLGRLQNDKLPLKKRKDPEKLKLQIPDTRFPLPSVFSPM